MSLELRHNGTPPYTYQVIDTKSGTLLSQGFSAEAAWFGAAQKLHETLKYIGRCTDIGSDAFIGAQL